MYKLLLLSLFFLLFVHGCSTKRAYKSFPKHTTAYQLQTDDTTAQKLYNRYKEWEGVSYCYGGEDKNGVDCSGFVQKIYKEAFDISIPRTTHTQIKVGRRVSRDSLKAGDLLFFQTSYKGLHSGIYLENDTFIHASSKYGVKLSNLKSSYWRQRFYQARRLLP